MSTGLIAVVLIGIVGVVIVAAALRLADAHADGDVMRNRENLRRRNIHANAGNLTYPHELADGTVRWYRMDHDPVDV